MNFKFKLELILTYIKKTRIQDSNNFKKKQVNLYDVNICSNN